MPRPTNEELNSLKQELERLITSSGELISGLQKEYTEFSSAIEDISTHLNTAEQIPKVLEASQETIRAVGSQINTMKESAEDNYKEIKELSKTSSVISEAVKQQEFVLAELLLHAEGLRQRTEALLPGAASAGLASAFKERKESFRSPKKLWGSVFVLSIVALVVVAAFSDSLPFELTTLNYETIYLYIFIKLPFVAPLVWLAVYAGRRHSQALRLEEDYAHKEVLSKSFEGYKNQLMEIESESDSGRKQSTLGLIETTLEALSLHPGRIYQGKHDDITPLNAVTNVVKKIITINDKDKP
jgi:DNA repair exonuclease SbcCD ATPase subunit